MSMEFKQISSEWSPAVTVFKGSYRIQYGDRLDTIVVFRKNFLNGRLILGLGKIWLKYPGQSDG